MKGNNTYILGLLALAAGGIYYFFIKPKTVTTPAIRAMNLTSNIQQPATSYQNPVAQQMTKQQAASFVQNKGMLAYITNTVLGEQLCITNGSRWRMITQDGRNI